MRPNALRPPHQGTPLRSELADYLRVSGSHLSMAQAAGLAVRAWIASDQADRASRVSAGATTAATMPAASGYLWKTVFLPHGTQLRMRHGDDSHVAEVIGQHIIFRGHSVSPRGMTVAVAGNGRNAWRDLTLKLPGERFWKRASRVRIESCIESCIESSPALRGDCPPVPQALSNAAQALAQAFSAALALGVPAAPSPSAPATEPERRSATLRRQADLLGESCRFD